MGFRGTAAEPESRIPTTPTQLSSVGVAHTATRSWPTTPAANAAAASRNRRYDSDPPPARIASSSLGSAKFGNSMPGPERGDGRPPGDILPDELRRPGIPHGRGPRHLSRDRPAHRDRGLGRAGEVDGQLAHLELLGLQAAGPASSDVELPGGSGQFEVRRARQVSAGFIESDGPVDLASAGQRHLDPLSGELIGEVELRGAAHFDRGNPRSRDVGLQGRVPHRRPRLQPDAQGSIGDPDVQVIGEVVVHPHRHLLVSADGQGDPERAADLQAREGRSGNGAGHHVPGTRDGRGYARHPGEQHGQGQRGGQCPR